MLNISCAFSFLFTHKMLHYNPFFFYPYSQQKPQKEENKTKTEENQKYNSCFYFMYSNVYEMFVP